MGARGSTRVGEVGKCSLCSCNGSSPPEAAATWVGADLMHATDDPGRSPKVLSVKNPSTNFCIFDLELGELAELSAKGKPDGVRPSHCFHSGAIYTGQWKGQARHGFGIMRWPSGSSYEGSWVNNCAEGLGRFVFAEGDTYVGQWEANMFHGCGVYEGPPSESNGKPGTSYSGQWIRDKREGIGVESDGAQRKAATYCGQFAGDEKHGFGVCSWPDGEYSGEWQNNNMKGRGKYQSTKDGFYYSGEWHKCEKHGVGRYVWEDKRCFEGQYVRDQAFGFGIFSWPEGNRYEGWWQGRSQQVCGRYTTVGGRPMMPQRKVGHPNGQGKS